MKHRLSDSLILALGAALLLAPAAALATTAAAADRIAADGACSSLALLDTCAAPVGRALTTPDREGASGPALDLLDRERVEFDGISRAPVAHDFRVDLV